MSNKIDTKDKILDAAQSLFMKQGFDGTSVNMIAKEVGISKAALYYHFINKHDILVKIVERALENSIPYIKNFELLNNDIDGKKDINIVDNTNEYFNFFKNENETFTIALVEILKQSKDTKSLLLEIPKQMFLKLEEDSMPSNEEKILIMLTVVMIVVFESLSDRLEKDLNIDVKKTEELIKSQLINTFRAILFK